MLLFILLIAVSGLIIGALGRLAVPGPDPMSIWMTIGIGIVGSLVGGLVSRIFLGGYFSFVLAVAVAALLVYLIRRSQGRAFWGPGARRPPAV
jgi:uncharacterized membrane protein YeaQ/YmgE (transglycosylase-associated protein family)